MLNTSIFEKIRLSEMDKVKLMNRTDTKYWFHFRDLQKVLDAVKEDYYVLNIDGKELMAYTTTYFDTEKNEMFVNHHKGKLNRYKIRKRTYINSGISFLETKFKSNKGRTMKKRIPISENSFVFTKEEEDFLKTTAPYSANDLQPSLQNEFSRITLVNKNFNERCTIDLNLHFKIGDKELALDNMVIIEIKTEGKPRFSPLAKVLLKFRIKTSGFSKYAIGRVVTDTSLKRNSFKAKVRSIEKMFDINNKLYKTA